MFQFTRPRGARQHRICQISLNHQVSIHAPTGGATSCFRMVFKSFTCFNSRAHGGRDHDSGHAKHAWMFQFTRPRGARQKIFRKTASNPKFQFTRPRGGATLASQEAYGGLMFQFTRPRGGATAYILSYPIVGLQGGFPRTCPFFWIVFSYCQ